MVISSGAMLCAELFLGKSFHTTVVAAVAQAMLLMLSPSTIDQAKGKSVVSVASSPKGVIVLSLILTSNKIPQWPVK